jgi:hypothetical protein
VDVQESDDPEGLRVFYYLVQDLKTLAFSLINLHFKVCYPEEWLWKRDHGLTLHPNTPTDQADLKSIYAKEKRGDGGGNKRLVAASPFSCWDSCWGR